jgi:DNA-directed RNA polymerase subunit RPC12/RpoP
MTIEHDFARLIDLAPKVQCPRCEVEMTLRTLVPVPETTEYTVGYRCSKCGTDTQREITVQKA